MSLEEIIDHIYGRANMISRTDRPNMFIKELKIYMEYLSNEIDEASNSLSVKKEKYFLQFISNLQNGIKYYQNLFGSLKNQFKQIKTIALEDLKESIHALNSINEKIHKVSKV